MENIKNMPLLVLDAWKALQKDCEQWAITYEHIVTFSYSGDPFSMSFRDKDNDSKFAFNITTPTLDQKSKAIANITYYPKNQLKVAASNNWAELNQVKNIFNHWIGLVERYNSHIMVERYRKFEEQYETEFFTDFQILDDDADINPYDNKKQTAITLLLEAVIKEAQSMPSQNEHTAEIIRQAAELKENIHILTKKNVVKRLSKLATKIKMAGRDFSKAIWTATKRETTKYMLDKGLDWIYDVVINNTHHLH